MRSFSNLSLASLNWLCNVALVMALICLVVSFCGFMPSCSDYQPDEVHPFIYPQTLVELVGIGFSVIAGICMLMISRQERKQS